MITPFQMPVYPDGVSVSPTAAPDISGRPHPRFSLWFLVLLAVGTLIWMAHEDFLEEKDGETVLAPWRKGKMLKELEDMEYGEQYALMAEWPGYYPCYHCRNTKEIFLNIGDVWKYGVTSKDEKGRYKGRLPAEGLYYVIEFDGLLQECYRREKLQIYNYALLPENLRRADRLIRPPGNKQDN